MLSRIGFIGIGNMGQPMAARLAGAGYRLAVLDADPARSAAFAEQHGARVAESAKDLAWDSEVVITMLPNSDVVGALLLGDAGVLAGLPAGSVVIEMSSGAPARTVAFAEAVAAAGSALVDAPVSGGVSRAVTGDLSIMVGGDGEVVARIEPVLRAMGSTIQVTGKAGTAHAMKALNNLVSAGGFLIGVEALLIGRKFGLDPVLMTDVLNASTGMNNSTQKKFKQFVLSRQFNSGFGLDLMVKDLSIALGIAEDSKAAVPFAALCRELWAAAANTGPGQDHTAMAKFSESLANAVLDARPL